MSDQELQELFSEPIDGYETNEIAVDPQTTIDITKRIYAIKAIERKRDQIGKQYEESCAFYERKIAQLEKQIEFIEGNIGNYLAREGMKSIQTPAGNASLSKHERWIWNMDRPEIIEYIRNHEPTLLKSEVKEDVSLSDLKKHFKETQNVPPEVASVTTEEKVTVRTI